MWCDLPGLWRRILSWRRKSGHRCDGHPALGPSKGSVSHGRWTKDVRRQGAIRPHLQGGQPLSAEAAGRRRALGDQADQADGLVSTPLACRTQDSKEPLFRDPAAPYEGFPSSAREKIDPPSGPRIREKVSRPRTSESPSFVNAFLCHPWSGC